jgi:uncharacterized protein YciI
MHFLLTAWDGTDAGALARRMAAREAHLARAKELHRAGTLLLGGAMLDDAGTMIGSTEVFEAPDRAAVEKIVRDDPYIASGVWVRWEIRPFRVAPLG